MPSNFVCTDLLRFSGDYLPVRMTIVKPINGEDIHNVDNADWQT